MFILAYSLDVHQICIFLDFLSELNKNCENKAERELQPVAVAKPATFPDAATGRVSRSASIEEGGGFADNGFKMPENFDIPQDYIQQIVPKRSTGKMPPVVIGHTPIIRFMSLVIILKISSRKDAAKIA